MTFDFYAELTSLTACPTTDGTLPSSLVSGFMDGCTVWSTRGDREKNESRQCYMNRVKDASNLKLPEELALDTRPSDLPDPLWIGFEVCFELQTPWYSKDDRPFHVLDNPVRKDCVFGVPYMSAASWKGLLRWACRMQAGLHEHLNKSGGKLDGWKDPSWILHLFGNEKGDQKDFQQGALAFYPTWFDTIGFEVINPHSRARRAGTQPIYYEVVPAETKGVLRLLYAPLPEATERDNVQLADATTKVLDAIENLLTIYGISAKRTVGWGTAKIEKWKGFRKERTPIEKTTLQEFKRALRS